MLLDIFLTTIKHKRLVAVFLTMPGAQQQVALREKSTARMLARRDYPK
jgi:hypothetical protein